MEKEVDAALSSLGQIEPEIPLNVGEFKSADPKKRVDIKKTRAQIKKNDRHSPFKPKEILTLEKMRMMAQQKVVEVSNVVNVDPKAVEYIDRLIDQSSSVIGQKLLTQVLPLLISYKAGTAYASAVMSDGLGIDLDFDESLFNSVKHLGYLSVLYHYVRNLKVPKEVKRQYMAVLTDMVARESATSLFKAEASALKSKLMSELHAYVSPKSSDTPSEKNSMGASKKRK